MFQKWENLKIWYSSIYWTTTTLIETANKNCRSNSRLTKNSSVFVASKNINKILFFVCHQHWLPTDLHMPSTWYKNLHSTKLIFNQKHSTSLDVLIFVIKKIVLYYQKLQLLNHIKVGIIWEMSSVTWPMRWEWHFFLIEPVSHFLASSSSTTLLWFETQKATPFAVNTFCVQQLSVTHINQFKWCLKEERQSILFLN